MLAVASVNILEHLLTAPMASARGRRNGRSPGRGPWADLGAFTKHLEACPFEVPAERALWAGFHADRLGYAFAGGYVAALARLFAPASKTHGPLAARACLCATESGGGHPRAILTRLDERGGELLLNGEKTFATLASASDELLVVASRGLEADGKNRLHLVRVRAPAPGLTITPREPTPFAPEVPHAIVRLVDVVVRDRDVLPGDGYEQWLKPFRTIEDIHVLASAVGYLAGAARAYDFGLELVAELVSLGQALVDVAAREPLAPVTHVLLAGIFASFRRLVAAPALESAWTKADEQERSRWQRDQPLLRVADSVRARRTESAFESLRT